MISQEPRDGETRRMRRTAPLGVELEKSLSAYASAAAASGVSLLMAALPAGAKIVYTPANINIPVNAGWVPIDLNHDGIADFSFSNYRFSTGSHGFGSLRAQTKNQSNEIWGRGNLKFASALRPGFGVGPNRSSFQKGSRWIMAETAAGGFSSFEHSATYGQWLYTRNRYLGLKFTVGGAVHYGWARFTVTVPLGIQATLTGYAYETTPYKPIVTGKTNGPDVITLKPATLGRLAQGASGISAWREKK